MRPPAPLRSEFSYFGKLLGAGWKAATAVRTNAANETPQQEWARAAGTAWLPALVGAVVGVSAVCLTRKHKTTGDALIGALVGGAVGFSGGAAWSSREMTSSIVRDAAKNMGAVRDGHWLEKHPICYG